MRQFIVLTAAGLAFLHCRAQTECSVQDQRVFEPQKKVVALVSKVGASPDAQFVLFQTRLRVNTDGAPNSYHPFDLNGRSKAINSIVSAINVRKDGEPVSNAEAIRVFEFFRDHDWSSPAGYHVTWQNVLAARKEGPRTIPCVFTSGEYTGYFGSLTALKNNLFGAAAGECGVANQLDERFVPALVIAGGSNPLRDFNVDTGDLLVAVNPNNGTIQAALVGDSGPKDNLGEGSVALNMSLLKRTQQPRNYSDAKALDTGSKEMIIAIIPKTAKYRLQQPYNADNITARVIDWLSTHGFESLQSFSTTAQACANKIGAVHPK